MRSKKKKRDGMVADLQLVVKIILRGGSGGGGEGAVAVVVVGRESGRGWQW